MNEGISMSDISPAHRPKDPFAWGSSTYSMRIAGYAIVAGCSVAVCMILVALGHFFSDTKIVL